MPHVLAPLGVYKMIPGGEPTKCLGKDAQNSFYKFLSGLFVKTGGLVVGKSSGLRHKKIPKFVPHVLAPLGVYRMIPGEEPTNCLGKDSQNSFYKLLSGFFVKAGGLVVGKSSELRHKKIPKCMLHVCCMMLVGCFFYIGKSVGYAKFISETWMEIQKIAILWVLPGTKN